MTFKPIHTSIRVFDLEKSINFYKEAFNFQINRKMDFPEWKFTLVFLKIPNTDFELELTYNYDPEKPYEIGTGYGHLAVGTEHLELTHQKHQEQNFNPTPLKGLSKEGKAQFYFLTDPGGYKIEIVRH